MTDERTNGDSGGEGYGSKQRFGGLALLAGISTCVYGAISFLSWRFDFGSVTTDRPIVVVLCLFAINFAIYLFAISMATRAENDGKRLKLIIVMAIVFRVVMLFSLPIQEVDLYRYLWDGSVTTSGGNPFQYCPQQVILAGSPSTDADLERLVQLLDGDPALNQILSRVHFPELPTIYPPTSQAVFALSSLTSPAESSLLARLFIMKAWFIVFDLATLGIVIALLRLCGKPTGLCLIYAWCPLLMKEVANSGHLDAVAVLLTTVTVYLAAKWIVAQDTNRHSASDTIRRPSVFRMPVIGIVLAVAVGSKLYPVVLAPLVFLTIGAKRGWRSTLMAGAVFALCTAAIVWPMMPRLDNSQDNSLAGKPVNDPSLGVVTFLRHWEMNDYLFMVLIENVKPYENFGSHEKAWFSVVPESAKQSIVNAMAESLGMAPPEIPFLIARVLSAILFIIVAVAIAWRKSSGDVSLFCEGAFLTLAWFWLLCPTQNPWYWTWALPLLPFARSRVWFVMSGLVMLYYLRFWLGYHFAETFVLGSPYTGTAFFDFVVTWIEYAPWLVMLAISWLRKPTELGKATGSKS